MEINYKTFIDPFIFSYIIILIIIIILFFTIQGSKETVFLENNDKTIHYIFWTGGFDSTFRLLQLLLEENKIVQPIYIKSNIDNEEGTSTRRFNQKQELTSIYEITKHILITYPNAKLLPITIVDTINISDVVKKNMMILHKQKKVRRATCQYGALAEYSLSIDKPVEISVENEPNSKMKKTVDSIIKNIDGKLVIDPNVFVKNPELKIFKNFVFPIINLSKKDMIVISKNKKYIPILKMTWSCWYPKNGKPCNRCIMCYDRPKF